jgi:hypothetical protein
VGSTTCATSRVLSSAQTASKCARSSGSRASRIDGAAGLQREVARVFGVEDAQGVALEPRLALGRELLAQGGEIRHEGVAVARAGALTAEGVDADLEVGDPEVADEARGELDALGVGRGRGVAVDLDAHLVELPVAPLRGRSARNMGPA